MYQIFPGLVVRMFFFPAKNSFPSGSQKHLKEILLLWAGMFSGISVGVGSWVKEEYKRGPAGEIPVGFCGGLAILGEDPCWLPDFYRTAGAQKAFFKRIVLLPTVAGV